MRLRYVKITPGHRYLVSCLQTRRAIHPCSNNHALRAKDACIRLKRSHGIRKEANQSETDRAQKEGIKHDSRDIVSSEDQKEGIKRDSRDVYPPKIIKLGRMQKRKRDREQKVISSSRTNSR